jgi:hypothetical protein
MFEKEAEVYFETVCLHSYADTEEQLKEDVVPAFQKGAEYGYNKAKKEMQEQIEKMKNCQNCRKFHNLSYDCTYAEVCNEWEIKENE